ncbi:hypothetical protein E4U52_006704 [Claviceps spartinae]|nr:hypothetical protein E4U52_006704 [Claviceps spartinae]
MVQLEALEVLLHGVDDQRLAATFHMRVRHLSDHVPQETSEPANVFNGVPSESTPATELSSESASVAGFLSEALPAWGRIIALRTMLSETRSDAMRKDIRSTIRRLFDEIE